MSKANVIYYVNYPFRMTGANYILFNLVSSRKDNSIVIFQFKGLAYEYFKSNGIKVHSLDYRPKWIGSFGKTILTIKPYQLLFQLIPELITLFIKSFHIVYKLNRSGYKMVHFNDTRGVLTAGWVFKLMRFKILVHIHGEFDAKNPSGMRWRTSKWLADQFIAVSNYLRNKMDSKGMEMTTTIYNGIREEKINQVIPFLKNLQKSGIKIYLAVVSVVPFKGIHVLLDALSKADENIRTGSLFVIVGPKPDEYADYQSHLASLVIKFKLEPMVMFVGWQNNIDSFMNSSDFLIHPSMSIGSLRIDENDILIEGNEGLPTCIIEAMKYGIVPIASNISGIPEQISSESGILVEPNNVNELLNAVSASFELKKSAYNLLATRSTEIFNERFSLNGFRESIEKIYCNISDEIQ